jgi:hypothetical protein
MSKILRGPILIKNVIARHEAKKFRIKNRFIIALKKLILITNYNENRLISNGFIVF